MFEKYIPKRFATAMIKHVIAVTLFFPYFYAKNDNPAYADFILANFFAILTVVFICTSWKLEFKKNAIFVTGLSILLVAYNVCATYMNVKYHHWYGEQINTTIAFLFFIVLLLVKDIHALIDSSTIKATIHMIVASNVLAILFKILTGKYGICAMNDWIQIRTYVDPKHFVWLYSHKCEYGFMLVLEMAIITIYRKHFNNMFAYWLSQGIMVIALYLSNSYTALGAAFFIFIGLFLDYLVYAKWWKKVASLLIIPTALFFVLQNFLEQVKQNRNLLTLGNRVYIWETFIGHIRQNPNGVIGTYGADFYLIEKWIDEWGITMKTNNCHNVFLNHLFRFSIPVGSIYIALFILLILLSIKRNVYFKTICIWLALLTPMMMDASLSAIVFPFFLLGTFMLFFNNSTNNFQNINKR